MPPPTQPRAPSIPRSTASSRAYEVIRDLILSGRFGAGDRIKEAELEVLCGVSRTPIREALRRLGTEGLVVENPHHGVQVVSLSTDDIEEIYALRAMVESHASARAATRISLEHIQEMKTCTSEMEAALADPARTDHERFMRANAQFHRVIWQAAMSPRLAHMAALVVEAPLVTRTVSSYTPADRLRSVRHHGDIIAAFEARNPDWAASVMSGHIHAASDALTRSLKASERE